VKHYNAGHVWGRISHFKETKTKRGKGVPYLRLQIECANELYGNVKAYGKMFGKDRFTALLDHYKKHPGSAYRFRGFFSQYDDDEGRRLSNYTFFEWNPFEGSEYRASFILAGQVEATGKKDGEGTLVLNVVRKGQGGYSDIDEEFTVWTFNAQEVAEISEGDRVHVKGLLRAREGEDMFGEMSSNIKPYVMEMRVNDKETEEEPF
jgi:hypothetical protein